MATVASREQRAILAIPASVVIQGLVATVASQESLDIAVILVNQEHLASQALAVTLVFPEYQDTRAIVVKKAIPVTLASLVTAV